MKAGKVNRRRLLKRAGCPMRSSRPGYGSLPVCHPARAPRPGAVTQTRETQAALTPVAALKLLKDGNARFVRGRMLDRNLMRQVKLTQQAQFPFAAIVGCIDSRESPQLIFDQGIGDIFNVTIAGNFVNDDIVGSLEFCCAASGARLIVVVGHTECSAIKAACDDMVLGNLTHTLANIKPAVAAVSGIDGARSSANPSFVQAVADANVALAAETIRRRSQILRDMEAQGDIAITGAMYDVHTGHVTFTEAPQPL